MDTLVYVAVITLAFVSDVTATILIMRFKKKGLGKCEDDLYK